MDYNPYEAPASPFSTDPNRPSVSGEPQPWSPDEVLRSAWETVKRYWVVLIFAPALGGFVAGIPNNIPSFAMQGGMDIEDSSFWIMLGVCSLIGAVIQAFVQVGLIRIYCDSVRGKEPDFSDLFKGADRFLPMLGLNLLVGILVLLGLVLFIVPGIILGLGLSLSQFYCVDAKMGALESMVASWEATKGQRWQLFVFGLYAFGVILLGLVACCVGVYVAGPVISVAMTTIYLRISGRQGGDPLPTSFGFGPPPGNPPFERV
jgi:hypothetical protein